MIHPEAFSDQMPFKNYFNAGTVAINATDGYPGWTQYILDNASNPKFKLGLMPVYTRESGELAPWHQGQRLLLDHRAEEAGRSREAEVDLAGAELAGRSVRHRGVPLPAVRRGGCRSHGQRRRRSGADQDRHRQHRAADPLPGRRPGLDLHAGPAGGRRHPARVPGEGAGELDLQSDGRALLQHLGDQELGGGQGLQRRHQGDRPGPEADEHLDELVKKWRTDAGDGMRQEFQDQLQEQGSK